MADPRRIQFYDPEVPVITPRGIQHPPEGSGLGTLTPDEAYAQARHQGAKTILAELLLGGGGALLGGPAGMGAGIIGAAAGLPGATRRSEWLYADPGDPGPYRGATGPAQMGHDFPFFKGGMEELYPPDPEERKTAWAKGIQRIPPALLNALMNIATRRSPGIGPQVPTPGDPMTARQEEILGATLDPLALLDPAGVISGAAAIGGGRGAANLLSGELRKIRQLWGTEEGFGAMRSAIESLPEFGHAKENMLAGLERSIAQGLDYDEAVTNIFRPTTSVGEPTAEDLGHVYGFPESGLAQRQRSVEGGEGTFEGQSWALAEQAAGARKQREREGIEYGLGMQERSLGPERLGNVPEVERALRQSEDLGAEFPGLDPATIRMKLSELAGASDQATVWEAGALLSEIEALEIAKQNATQQGDFAMAAAFASQQVEKQRSATDFILEASKREFHPGVPEHHLFGGLDAPGQRQQAWGEWPQREYQEKVLHPDYGGPSGIPYTGQRMSMEPRQQLPAPRPAESIEGKYPPEWMRMGTAPAEPEYSPELSRYLQEQHDLRWEPPLDPPQPTRAEYEREMYEDARREREEFDPGYPSYDWLRDSWQQDPAISGYEGPGAEWVRSQAGADSFNDFLAEHVTAGDHFSADPSEHEYMIERWLTGILTQEDAPLNSLESQNMAIGNLLREDQEAMGPSPISMESQALADELSHPGPSIEEFIRSLGTESSITAPTESRLGRYGEQMEGPNKDRAKQDITELLQSEGMDRAGERADRVVESAYRDVRDYVLRPEAVRRVVDMEHTRLMDLWDEDPGRVGVDIPSHLKSKLESEYRRALEFWINTVNINAGRFADTGDLGGAPVGSVVGATYDPSTHTIDIPNPDPHTSPKVTPEESVRVSLTHELTHAVQNLKNKSWLDLFSDTFSGYIHGSLNHRTASTDEMYRVHNLLRNPGDSASWPDSFRNAEINGRIRASQQPAEFHIRIKALRKDLVEAGITNNIDDNIKPGHIDDLLTYYEARGTAIPGDSVDALLLVEVNRGWSLAHINRLPVYLFGAGIGARAARDRQERP